MGACFTAKSPALLAGAIGFTLKTGRGAGPSSSRGHQQPYLWGCKATFLRHASHRPALLERQGWLSVWELLFFLLHVQTCPVTGPSHYWSSQGQDWSVYPHPRANSPCHHLTVGWPPTWHPAGTVTRDSRGILPHRDSLEQVACGYWHSVDPLHLVRPWGYSVGRKLPSCWLQVHMGYLLLTTPRERAGCGLRGCW